jgi:hypothetical protein
MQVAMDQDRPSVGMLVAVIAHSQIVAAAPARRLPAGFDDVDVAILDWIAAEGRRAGHRYARM